MSIGKTEVEKIAHLARLLVDEGEIEAYARELSRILEFVAEMDLVDTHGVTPIAHPLDMSQRMRADEVTETDDHESYQACAPSVEKGLYLVPKVIE